MDLTWHRSRLHRYCIAALALALSSPAFAVDALFQAQSASPNYAAQRNVIVTNASGQNLLVRADGGSYIQLNAGASRTVSKTIVFNFTGLTQGGEVTQSKDMPGVALDWKRTGGQSGMVGSKAIDPVNVTGKCTWGNQIVNPYMLEAITFSIDENGGVSDLLDPYGPQEPPPQQYDVVLLMLDNQTNMPQEMQLGDEVLLLQPGMNSIPYYGPVDDLGFPTMLPPGFAGTIVPGADGADMLHGVLRPGIEYGPPAWAPPVGLGPGGLELFPPSNNSSGPTLRAPGPNGNPVYNTLPSGMTPGNIVPLPGGMTPGTPGLPPGVTPGTSGALPNGIASGGSSNLPPGVSPGTTANPYPPTAPPLPPSGIRPPGTRTTDPGTTAGGGGSGGGTSGGGGTSSGGSTAGGSTTPSGGIVGGNVGSNEIDPNAEPGFNPGSSLLGLPAEARQLGESSAGEMIDSVSGALGGIGEGASSPFGTEGFGFWTGPGESFFDGYDTSWMNFTLQLGVKSVSIEIPPQWISLVRSILLWIIRIFFVFGCIKLVMK